MATLYDAFISYSHAKDKPVAAALQSVVQTLGKPWYRRRTVRIFRDDTSLSATPHLWPSIEDALRRSRNLILLASPEAARSPWVGKEVEFWLRHRDPTTLLIALTDGDLTWDGAAGDFVWSAGTPLPAPLRGAYTSEPLWIDLKLFRGERTNASRRNTEFVARAASIAAAVRGVPKEDLFSEELTQQRRALTTAWSGAAGLAALAGLAAWQYGVAESARKVAVARQLASKAQLLAIEEPVKVELAVTLAIESLSRQSSVEADQFLRTNTPLLPRLVSTSRHAVKSLGALVLSHDGKMLATAAYGEKLIQIVDAKTQAPIRSIFYGNRAPVALAFSPDGRNLIAAGQDQAVETWDIASGNRLSSFPVPELQRSSLALISRDARLLLTSVDDKTLQVREIDSGAVIPHLARVVGGPSGAFSDDGRFLIVNRQRTDEARQLPDLTERLLLREGYVADVIEVATGRVVQTIKTDGGILGVALGPDGTRALVVGIDGLIRIIDVGSGDEKASFRSRKYVNMRLHVSPDGSHFGTIDPDGVLELWSVASGQIVLRRSSKNLPGGKGFMDEWLSFGRDGRTFATGDYSGIARVWEMPERPPEIEHDGRMDGSPFAATQAWFARVNAMRGASVEITDMATRREVGVQRHQGRITALAFTHDDRILLTSSFDGSVGVLDIAGGRQRRLSHEGQVWGVAASPDSLHAASVSDGLLKVWSLAEDAVVFEKRFEPGSRCIALGPGARFVVTCSAGAVLVLETMSGGTARSLPIKGGIETLKLTRDGRLLGIGDRSGNLAFYETAKLSLIRAVKLESGVRDIAFHDDGRHIATASNDGTVRVWNMEDGRELLRLRHLTPVSAVAFTPNGNGVLFNVETLGPGAVIGGRVMSVTWRSDEILAQACRHVIVGLSPQQWSEYVGDERFAPYCSKAAQIRSIPNIQPSVQPAAR